MAKGMKFSARESGNHKSGHSPINGIGSGAAQNGKGKGMMKSYMGGGGKHSNAGNPSGKMSGKGSC